MLSTVRAVRVPRLVTLPCAAVARVPVMVPVELTVPAMVIFPANATVEEATVLFGVMVR